MEVTKSNGRGSGLLSKITETYVLLMLGVFPLYVRYDWVCDLAERFFEVQWKGRYYDMIEGKTCFFQKLTLSYLVVMAIASAILWLRGRKRAAAGGTHDVKNEKKSFPQRLRALFGRMTAVDKAFTVFILANLLSMIFSGYPYEAWHGNLGRYMGVYSWLLLYGIYFCISRSYGYRRWHLNVFLLSGGLACLWGITDFFWKDIFGFFSGVGWHSRIIFQGPIGNINSYTSLTGMVFALSGALLIKEKNKGNIIFAAVIFLISTVASIYGTSDSAILAMGGALFVIPLFMVENRRELIRYLSVITLFFLGMGLSSRLLMIFTDNNLTRGGEEGILLKLGGTVLVPGGAILAFLLCLSILIYEKKSPWPGGVDQKLQKRLRIGFLTVLITGMIAMVAILMDANAGRHEAVWAPYKNILLLDDRWGTGRGYIWRTALAYFLERFTILQKLFGICPEGFYMITMDHFMDDMLALGYGMFDQPHNEYLNILVNLGVFGLFSWLGYLWMNLKKLCRNHRSEIAVMLFAYMAQAVINFWVPMVLPILIILLSTACTRKKACKDEEMW